MPPWASGWTWPDETFGPRDAQIRPLGGLQRDEDEDEDGDADKHTDTVAMLAQSSHESRPVDREVLLIMSALFLNLGNACLTPRRADH